MPHVIEKTVFDFDELDDRAKDKARDWYRTGQLDYDWYEFIYEDAQACGKILGIEIAQRAGKTMGGHTVYSPIIYFSGFSSQGDGACFEGDYAYAKGAAKAIRAHAPEDKELHRIADDLRDLQRKNFYRLTARMKHRGHYYHSNCMEVSVDDNETRRDGWLEIEQELTQLMRAFADWLYRQLEKECEYLQADAQVDESIRANEYTFDETGNRSE